MNFEQRDLLIDGLRDIPRYPMFARHKNFGTRVMFVRKDLAVLLETEERVHEAWQKGACLELVEDYFDRMPTGTEYTFTQE